MMLGNSYYDASIIDFLAANPDTILGKLTKAHPFSLEEQQRNAWLSQIDNLKDQLRPIQMEGHIFFEFSIPRVGKRVDVVLFIRGVVFVVEYKVGAQNYDRMALEQVFDYALDLKNFHKDSHDRYIVPILIATGAKTTSCLLEWGNDKVASPCPCGPQNLEELIHRVSERFKTSACASDAIGWSKSPYKPTPTIIEAARALYDGHSVEEISRSDAGALNLTQTTKSIMEIIDHARLNGRKAICFVTGVPGSGKTLAGLNISVSKINSTASEHAVFLSGNGPLVAVLRAALIRDNWQSTGDLAKKTKKSDIAREVNAFIQNVHHFRDAALNNAAPPSEHVVIFDEAQRAWDQAQTERFMRRKKGKESFEHAEADFLISYMDRRKDWSVIICLVGNGQEINKGEAGISEWFRALGTHFRHWDVYHSGQEVMSADNLLSGFNLPNVIEKKPLHLSVSLRSFRAEKLSEFVDAIIDCDEKRARRHHQKLGCYPIAITRNIDAAREWLRKHARGSARFGLVASSGARRLKSRGIDVKARIDPVPWFLNDKTDVRSSCFLEEVATEFVVQGLELDWVGLCWDANFRIDGQQWSHHRFRGTKWECLGNVESCNYLANAYRVLLTRARQGMVIFVPEGDDSDDTRKSTLYDETYGFLKACGISDIR